MPSFTQFSCIHTCKKIHAVTLFHVFTISLRFVYMYIATYCLELPFNELAIKKHFKGARLSYWSVVE